MAPPTESVDVLLAHAGWVRQLARHLVRDPERAEDLVQDTWVAALDHPPRAPGSVASTRAFLGRILRNALLHRARGERHRHAREAAHARPEAVDGGAELIEAVDSQRMLLEEVLRLAEPARRTILLRYFRELSAAEIARLEGIPGATVRARLARGLVELRARLDARHGGDREAWALGVLAWAQTPRLAPTAPPAPTTSPLLAAPALEGLALMKTAKLAVLAGITALAALGVYRIQRPPTEAARRGVLEEPPALAALAPAPAPEPVRARPVPDVQREAVAPAPESEPAAEAGPAPRSAAATAAVSARFVDPDGTPLPGVELRLESLSSQRSAPAVAPVRSDGRGLAGMELALANPRAFAVFSWRAEGYEMGGRDAELAPGATIDLGTLVLVPGTPVLGRVVDPSGRPIAGARVWLGPAALPEGDRGQIERLGPHSVSPSAFERDTTPTVTSEKDGSFRLPGAAPGDARVWAHAPATRFAASAPFEVAGPEVTGIEVVLPPLAAGDRIEGRVVSADGIPVAGAEVRYALHDADFGLSSMETADEEGRFRIVVWRRVPHALTALGPEGSGVAHAARVEPGTLDLELRLGEQDSYELAVTDPEGRPVESFRVTTCLGTRSSWTGRVEPGKEHPGGRIRIGTPEAAFWIEVRAAGFALGTLGPFEPATVPPLLELALVPAPGISGRVLLDGAPRAGVRVELYRATEDTTRLVVNGFPAHWQLLGENATTDEEGRFLLMPRRAGEFLVRATADGHAPAESDPVRLAANTGASDVDVHLGAGGTLVVQVVAPPGADAAGVVVAATRGDGHPLTRRADADGRAVFEGLMPGRWNVVQTESEIDPAMTFSSSEDVDGAAPEERPWVVEVLEGRTARHVLVLSAASGR